jgi:hypothetical protein
MFFWMVDYIFMKRLFLLIPFIVAYLSTQKHRETCLDWYAYRIDTAKTIELLNLETKKESDLMVYCEYFRNVADTN